MAQVAYTTYRRVSPLPVTGYAMFYNPNVMQEVMSNRLRMGHISLLAMNVLAALPCCGAAILTVDVWIQWADGVIDGTISGSGCGGSSSTLPIYLRAIGSWMSIIVLRCGGE